MKHILLPIVVFIGLSVVIACSNTATTESNSTHKKTLDASLVNNPFTADSSNEVLSTNNATMDFEDTVHDFGKLYDGEMASYAFKFKNNGKAPLLISNAVGSCGCTVPDYPHSPVLPGESAVVNVKYNSLNKVGTQNKTVTLYTNSNKGTHTLTILAEVLEKK